LSQTLMTLFNLLGVLVLVFLNGFFVAAEFAMVRIRQSRVQQLVQEGNRRAVRAHRVLQHLDAYLSATQLGITLASLGLGWIGEPAVARLIESPLTALGVPSLAVHTVSFVIAFAVITFLHIVLGELAPKSLAIHRAEGTVLFTAWPMHMFYKIMYPFIWFLNGTANLLLRSIGIQPATEGELAHTEEEIRMLVNQSHRSGLIDQTEMALFDSVFDFSERIAREIMVPRIDMVTIDINESREEVLAKIRREQHTRYPVIREDKDHVLGFIHIKDFYLHLDLDKPFHLQNVLRKIIFVSESAEISHVLRMMQKHRTQMAIVVDEFGGTAGLITMEDIIEELVGEIRDEFDIDEIPPVQTVPEGYLVEGRVLVDEINDLLRIHLNNEDVDTIGGWVYGTLGRIPEPGETVEAEGYRFRVEELEGHRVERVRITKAAPPEKGFNK
jgi:CBS domain containing-hemolysin-like protein